MKDPIEDKLAEYQARTEGYIRDGIAYDQEPVASAMLVRLIKALRRSEEIRDNVQSMLNEDQENVLNAINYLNETERAVAEILGVDNGLCREPGTKSVYAPVGVPKRSDD